MGGLSGSWVKIADADSTTYAGARAISTVGSIDMLGTGSGGIGQPSACPGSNGGGGGPRSGGGWPGGGGASFGLGADGCVIVEY